MAHRDGAKGAADIVDPQGAARAGTGGDAVTPQGTPEPTDGARPDATEPDAPGTPESPATGAAQDTEPAPGPGRRPRLPRPSTGRTPAFGLALGAIRQRAAGATEGTAELRRNLADKEAQTNELREALDALRQALDDTTPPSGPEAPVAPAPRRRRPLLLLLAVVAVVAVVVVALAVRGSGGGTSTATPPASTSGPATPSASASSAPPATSTSTPPAASSSPAVSSPPGPAVRTTPMPWRGGTLLTPPAAPASGPGVDAPGTDVTVAIDKDLASIDVFERALFSTPQTAVTLAVPPASVWSTGLPQARPVVTDLQVVLDGTPVRPQRTDAGWFALPANGGTVTRVELRYRVGGTIVNYSGPGSKRRLIGVPSFTGQASLDASAKVHVTVDDPRVDNLFCLSANPGLSTCSENGADGLTTTLGAGSSPVVALQGDVVPLG